MRHIGAKFSELAGKTLVSVSGEAGDDLIVFTTADGEKYELYHEQDCCESVLVDSIVGDLTDLIGTPILMAEESTSGENPAGFTPEYQGCFTWTFYKLATIKGYVDIRWYGESNGYYSESVSFRKVGRMSHTETLRAALEGVMRYLDGDTKLCGHKLDCPCALHAARTALAATAEPEQSTAAAWEFDNNEDERMIYVHDENHRFSARIEMNAYNCGPMYKGRKAALRKELEEIANLVANAPTLTAQLAAVTAENKQLLTQYSSLVADGIKYAGRNEHSVLILKEELKAVTEERDFAVTHLALMFDAYEDGTACYEDPEENAGLFRGECGIVRD